jgi:alpha-mannosidase
VCAALGDGRALAVRVESSLGTASLAVEEAAADVFLGAVLGFDVPPGTAEVTLPAAYRGQPALLDIESAHDQNLPSWMVADWPHGVRRELAPEATAQGAVRVDIPAPAALPEPRTRLTVGDGDLREVIRRVRFLVREMNVGLGEAAEACRQGLRALAQGSFAGAAQALREVERGLAAAQPDRRAEQVTLVGHAHIDMNWLWAMAETRQVCHDTFRQVLAFMEEFPPFTFSQSQASTYQLLERLDPALFERLRQRVKEGRWELLGGMVDEGDTNLSSGEALARSFLLGQGYFLKTFDRLATVGWLPDNFGHVAQLPQILRLAGIGSFYGHRCMPKQGPFVWEGSDGSRVLVYVTPTYNGEITPRLRDLPAEYDPQHRKLIWVYGVGDHGGGPTRRDVTRAIAYDRMPGFPTIRFGTAEEFFRSLAPDVPDYPVHRGELQYIFEGCYTSIARIKEGNRRCESSLYGGELLSALLSLDGFRYPADTLRAAWQTLAFNQFHDILCGSAVHESNRESIAAYDVALDQAEEVRYSALRTLASKVPTAAARGQPVVVFNPLARPVTDVVEAELFTYLQPPTARLQGWGTGGTVDPATFVSRAKPVDLGQGPYATIALADEAGAPVDAQIVEGKVFPHGYRIKVRLVAKDVPACGHRLFYARPAECPGKPQATLEVTGTTVQTPFLRVEVNPRTGHVTRIYDRVRRKEVLAKGAKANRLRIFMEKPHGMSAWNLGPISAVHELDKAEAVKVVEEGPVRAVIQVWRKWNRSAFVQRIIAHRDLPRVDFELDAHWFELGGPRDDAPMLRVAFPLNVKKGRFVCDTPFAAVERPTNGREVPAQKWTDLSSAVSGGAALLNAGKYGHRCEGATLEMTLLRASYEPDPYPDQGPHLIRYSLVPHAGDWKAAGVDEAGQRFNTPLMALETPPGQKGELGASGSLLSLGPDNLLLAAVKRAEDEDGLIVRFVESRGQTANAELTVPKAPKSAARVDLLERPLEGGAAPLLDGRSVRVAVRPHEIVSLRLRF